MISPSSVYRKGASPHRVPDALTPNNHRISLKSCVYARASGGNEGFANIADNKFVKQTCIK